MSREALHREVHGGNGGNPSGLRLFNVILVVRWASLAVASLGYIRNLSTHEMDYRHFIPMLAGAFVYTVLLSWFSTRVYESHMRSNLFLMVDYAVSLAAFSTTGAVWNPFLIFGACSFLFAGLRGTMRAGLTAGLALAGVLLLSLPIKALSYADLVAADSVGLALVYVLEFGGFSVAWAYSVGLLNRLDVACGSVADNRDHLASAKAALDERQGQLLALHRIRHAILLDLDAEEIVRIVMRALEEEGYSRCRTWLLEGGVLTAFPEDEGAADIDAFGDHPLAVAAHDRETVVTECERAGDTDDDELPPPCVAVPILTDTDVLGVVAIENDTGEPLPDERIEILELFVGQIALALGHVRLYERARDYAVAEERNRVTAEIHETVVRKMHDASLLTESLTEKDVPPEVAKRLQLLKDTILGSLQDLRFAVLNWSSLEWHSTPLKLAERYVREFTTLSGIPVTLESEGEERGLPAAKAKDLLRILQEALSNVWRHAKANTVHVRLTFEQDGVEMSIADDGAGFDTAAVARGTGIGLRSIEDRGKRHDGTVEVLTSPGKGTRVRVWMPCR